MPESLRAREKRIAAAAHSSSTPIEPISDGIGFPTDVRGLVIVDVGAGASPMVAELRRRGAEAYGVDPGYRNVQALVKSARNYAMTLGARYGREASSIRIEAANAFQQDYQRNRDRYKAELAGDMASFADNSADIVYSELAVSQFLIREDQEVFFGAIDEGLRILKPAESGIAAVRRSLVLHPWGRPQSWNQTAVDNAAALQGSLRERGIPFFVEPVDGGSPRLRIVKP